MNFQKKHCVAMLLAGGQGSRLMVLTENTAKACGARSAVSIASSIFLSPTA